MLFKVWILFGSFDVFLGWIGFLVFYSFFVFYVFFVFYGFFVFYVFFDFYSFFVFYVFFVFYGFVGRFRLLWGFEVDVLDLVKINVIRDIIPFEGGSFSDISVTVLVLNEVFFFLCIDWLYGIEVKPFLCFIVDWVVLAGRRLVELFGLYYGWSFGR